MISVVICSAQPARLQAVASNIEATIGVEYELIAVDNSTEGRGICAVYNEGASRARHPFVCFVHEDVEFLSQDWGVRALDHFSHHEGLALIGLAGSRYKAATPSGWHSGDEGDLCINVRHGASRELASAAFAKPADSGSNCCVPVVALDGVWLFVRRSAWAETRFDERLEGFHFYDVDFSLRVAQRSKIAVVFDIELLHFSLGSFAEAWARQALAYAAAAPVALPFSCGTPLNPDRVRRKEEAAVRYWLRLLRRAKLPWALRISWLRATEVLRYPALWRVALKFLLR
ncbi:glycosyltransferase [Phytopseudomonas punonensis]|uniref:Glycosyltransferase like family protein n=1 Tax=Phytopseudomonas punonensis TaxID=1220495 RepID=A0A1M7HTA1_9GAMM|nr:glycosyltransferase [Pseudomonas punonensis]SHM31563.1 Glycosyltransferase like family protein [Pseudomonas punonensis]